jgi:Glycoside Hydrolase Family 113
MDSDTAKNRDVNSSEFQIRARWMKIWLACVASWYPFWWAAGFLIFAAPALADWFVRGTSLGILRINLWLPVAVSQLPNHFPRRPPFTAMDDALVALAVAFLIAPFVAQRTDGLKRVLTGLAVAELAGVGMLASVTSLDGPRLTLTSALFLLAFFGAMLRGFWWILAGWRPCRYWVRVASLLAAFDLPLALLLGAAAVSQSRAFGPVWWGAVFLVPGFAGALLVSLQKPRQEPDVLPVRWRAIVNGAVVTLLLGASVAKAGPFITNGFEHLSLADNRAALAELANVPASAPYPKVFFQKGVSLSAEWPTPYGSEGARDTLLRLKTYGVDAIALAPYAAMREGSPALHSFGPHSMESDEGLREMARLAHALGMKVMLKPGIWVRGGGDAGELDFPSEAGRKKFFDDYGEFIDHYARLATQIHADLFCVGGELVKLSADEEAWRNIIARVRGIYPGPLTYAANFGTEFETLKFWDALDYIGLQDYYPLPAGLSTDAEVAKVEAVEEKYGKPVIFTEAGFASAPDANQHPWEDGKAAKPELGLQARCYAAIFRAFYSKPWFEGMYWWKIGTNGFGGPEDTSLTPWNKPAMEVVKQWYTSDAR